MKKYFFLIAFLLLSVPAFAQQAVTYGSGQSTVFGPGQAMVMSGGGGGCSSTCSSNPAVDNTATHEDNTAIGSDDNHYYNGEISFVATSCICKINFIMTLGAGTITGKTFVANLWHTSGTSLVSGPVATSSSVSGSQGWSYTPVAFTFTAPFPPAGTYAITVTMSGTDASNYAYSADTGGTSLSGNWSRWTSGLTQANGNVSYWEDMQVYYSQ